MVLALTLTFTWVVHIDADDYSSGVLVNPLLLLKVGLGLGARGQGLGARDEGLGARG